MNDQAQGAGFPQRVGTGDGIDQTDQLVSCSQSQNFILRAGIDAVLGQGACHVLSIRPQGGVEMEVEA